MSFEDRITRECCEYPKTCRQRWKCWMPALRLRISFILAMQFFSHLVEAGLGGACATCSSPAGNMPWGFALCRRNTRIAHGSHPAGRASGGECGANPPRIRRCKIPQQAASRCQRARPYRYCRNLRNSKHGCATKSGKCSIAGFLLARVMRNFFTTQDLA